MIGCKLRFYFEKEYVLFFSFSSFLHQNPDDSKEVPGGFLSDINPV